MSNPTDPTHHPPSFTLHTTLPPGPIGRPNGLARQCLVQADRLTPYRIPCNGYRRPPPAHAHTRELSVAVIRSELSVVGHASPLRADQAAPLRQPAPHPATPPRVSAPLPTSARPSQPSGPPPPHSPHSHPPAPPYLPHTPTPHSAPNVCQRHYVRERRVGLPRVSFLVSRYHEPPRLHRLGGAAPGWKRARAPLLPARDRVRGQWHHDYHHRRRQTTTITTTTNTTTTT